MYDIVTNEDPFTSNYEKPFDQYFFEDIQEKYEWIEQPFTGISNESKNVY